MSPLPDGKGARAPEGRRWFHLPWRNPRQKLTLNIRYTGGAEACIVVEARGSSGRFSGSTALFDVAQEIWQWDKHRPGLRGGAPVPEEQL